MTTRAKFLVNSITRTLGQRRTGEKDANGRDIYAVAEQWTLQASPVYGNNDPEHENSKFWAATPFGELKLTTVNADALVGFDLGKEFYVDLTPVS